MNSLPWHVGYFADEGEVYEWEPEEEGEQEEKEEDPETESPWEQFRRFPDDWKPDPEHYWRVPTLTTSIAATPYGMAVVASLIADMQRQLGHLPQRSGGGLQPIYGPIPVPGGLLGQVVASSETQITELQRLQNLRLPPPSHQGVSQEGLIQKAFSAVWANKTEAVVAIIATGALIYIVPKIVGGGGGVLPAFARAGGPLAALFIKTGRHAMAEADFQDKVDNFDYAGQEMSEIGTV